MLVATSTLAMGVNTPASAVVLAELEQWDGTPYSVAQYKNMIGRAGRLGFTERGRSFIIAPDFRSEHAAWDRYVSGEPEDVQSRFADADPRALMLRALASAGAAGMSPPELLSFLEESFAAWQHRQAGGILWSSDQLARLLEELERFDLVAAEAHGQLQLQPLGRLAGEAGVAIETILRLVDGARQVGPAPSAAALISLVQLTIELDEVYMPVNARGFRKESASWFGTLQRENVPGLLLMAMQRRGGNVDVVRRAKRAVGCLLWMSGLPRADIEAVLMRHVRENTVAGAVQGAVGRTIDLLPTAVRVVELIHGSDLEEQLDELLLRLQFGVSVDATALVRAFGDRLTRPQYQALVSRAWTDPAVIEGIDEGDLKSVIGLDATSRLQTLWSAPEAA